MQVVYLSVKRAIKSNALNSYESEFNALPISVKNKINSYKIENSRNDSFSAWVELNGVLKSVTGKTLSNLTLTYSNRGKPFISDGFVSLSHSNKVVAVGYSTKNFGVDIEKVVNDTSKYKSVAKKLLAPSGSNQFFIKWTEIESVAKLNDKFSFSVSEDIKVKSFLAYINGERYAISVACNENFKIEFIY